MGPSLGAKDAVAAEQEILEETDPGQSGTQGGEVLIPDRSETESLSTPPDVPQNRRDTETRFSKFEDDGTLDLLRLACVHPTLASHYTKTVSLHIPEYNTIVADFAASVKSWEGERQCEVKPGGSATSARRLFTDVQRLRKRCHALVAELNTALLSLDCIDLDSLKPEWGTRSSVRQARKELIQMLDRLSSQLEEILKVVEKHYVRLEEKCKEEEEQKIEEENRNRAPDTRDRAGGALGKRSAAGVLEYASKDASFPATRRTTSPKKCRTEEGVEPSSGPIGSRWDRRRNPVSVARGPCLSAPPVIKKLLQNGCDGMDAVGLDTVGSEFEPTLPDVGARFTGACERAIQGGGFGNTLLSSCGRGRGHRLFQPEADSPVQQPTSKEALGLGKISVRATTTDHEDDVTVGNPAVDHDHYQDNPLGPVPGRRHRVKKAPVDWDAKLREKIDLFKNHTSQGGCVTTLYENPVNRDTLLTLLAKCETYLEIEDPSPTQIKIAIETFIAGVESAFTYLQKLRVNKTQMRLLHQSASILDTLDTPGDLLPELKSLQGLLKTFGMF